MNTANLQLEGLLLAVATMNQALVAKGLMTPDEIDHSLAVAEQTALGDERVSQDLSPANRDAVAFPIRVLRSANSLAGKHGVLTFQQLAKLVGETKSRHNDQE